jgi:5-methylthioadenosine/S-adenosylhomocysteine deaminase
VTATNDSRSLVIRGCSAMVGPGSVRDDIDIVVAGGTIDRIRPAGDAPDGVPSIDGHGLLALPGMVNAHTHSAENCLRGSGACLPLEVWLTRMFGTAGPYTPEDHYVTALAGATEMLRSGTTAVLDHLWMTPPTVEAAEAVLRAYRDVGIRAAVAPLVADMDATGAFAGARGFDLSGALFTDLAGAQPPGEIQAQLEELIARWHGSECGRLLVFAGPAGPQWCSDELLERLGDTARRHETGLTLHMLESRLQRHVAEHRHCTGPVQVLDRLGILDERCSLAHGVWLDGGDIELIAERGAVVVHNPSANLRLGSGRADVPAMLAAGARLALGADGSSSSDDQVIWTQLKLASLVHNDFEEDRWVSPRQALAMATEGGAAALGLGDRLGVLRAGALADIVLLDRHGAGMAGAQDLEGALALSERGNGVVHVVVDGRLVVADGRCTRVDEADARAALAEQAARRAAGQVERPEILAAMAKMAALKAAVRDSDRG